MLLGRPWEYDKKVFHNGYKNTYTFVKDGKKVKLLPMQLEILQKSSKIPREAFITRSQVEEHLKRGEDMLFVVPKEKQDEKEREAEPIDPRVQQVLIEFNDLVSSEVPNSLPPMHSIQHQIDLILGAPLLNKAAYQNESNATRGVAKED